MSDQQNEDRAFHLVEEEGRVLRTSRMLQEGEPLKDNQRRDITERFFAFIKEHGYTQAAVAREIGISSTTISEVLRLRWKGQNGDMYLARVNNWMELTASRDSIVRSKEFVETSVAKEILTVARIVAETCSMGCLFGPAQIGKTFTLRAIEGQQRSRAPVVIRVEEFNRRPGALFRAICDRFELATSGTLDALFRRLVKRLIGTHRMLVFDEADRLPYHSLEAIRDLHDETECPVLLAGKPRIYERLGFRELGEFSEVTDQLASRIVIKRDLTERTRGKNPEPLYSLEDIRKLIQRGSLKLHVTPEAEKWLQDRASTLSLGGIGKALKSLYLACKVASAKGLGEITVDILEDVDALAMGLEDATRVADVVTQSSGMRKVV